MSEGLLRTLNSAVVSALMILSVPTFLFADEACEKKISERYALNKIMGQEIAKSLIKKAKGPPQITHQLLNLRTKKELYRIELEWLPAEKKFSVNAVGGKLVKFPPTIEDAEALKKKASGIWSSISKNQIYDLESNRTFEIFESAGRIVRLSLSNEFSCEFADFTECDCL